MTRVSVPNLDTIPAPVQIVDNLRTPFSLCPCKYKHLARPSLP